MRPPIIGRAIETPIGQLLALATDGGLCALEFTARGTNRPTRREPAAGSSASRLRQPGAELGRRLARWFAPYEILEGRAAALDRTCEWLSEYFLGNEPDTSAVPLDLRGAPFELRVWKALLEIPAGATTTYGTIARKLGAPNASRAVGAANGSNPIPLIVPCHRVIGSSGGLTGYGGGLDRKRWLLDHEVRWRRDAQPALF